VVRDVDLNEYSTPLDRDSAFYKKHQAQAQEIARSLLTKGSGNRHMMEERDQLPLQDFDEEEMYSAVARPGQDDEGQKV
jgi:PAB1-binding protein PBP1